jgi:hypothetical protein
LINSLILSMHAASCDDDDDAHPDQQPCTLPHSCNATLWVLDRDNTCDSNLEPGIHTSTTYPSGCWVPSVHSVPQEQDIVDTHEAWFCTKVPQDISVNCNNTLSFIHLSQQICKTRQRTFATEWCASFFEWCCSYMRGTSI